MSPPPARSSGRLGRGLERLLRFAQRDIWLLEATALPFLLGLLTRTARVLMITVRGFFRDRCLQQAAALTYVTLFSLPSALAFAFAVAKGSNAYGDLRTRVIVPFLDATFGAAPTEAGLASTGAGQLRDAIDKVFQYVERSDLKAMGGIALALMLYAVLKLLGAVEGSLNDIWGVKRARSLLRRVSDYLAIVVITPVFLLLATGATTFLEGSFALQRDIPLGLGGASVRLLPLLAVWFGLTFVYLTLPNTRVRIPAALLGGLVAGSIWQAIQVLHVTGQIELARYNAIYSSFAAIPMLLLWMYLSWSVFLIGAELSFAFQNEPAFTSMARTGKVDQQFRERIAPRLAARVTRAFLAGQPAPTTGALAAELGVAPRTVSQVLDALVSADLLARTSVGLDDGFLPARDPGTITVLDVLVALRREEGASEAPVRGRLDERVDRVLEALEGEARRSLSNHTLTELARTPGEEAEERPSEGGAPRPVEA